MPKAPYQFLPNPTSESFRVLEFKGSNTGCSWHFHSEFQLSLILKGRGQRVIGDTIHPIASGELTLLGANLPHVWRYDPESGKHVHVIVIHFREDFAGRDFLAKSEMRGIKLLLTRAAQGLQVQGKTRTEIKKIVATLPTSKGFDRVLGLMKILNILAASKDLTSICGPRLKLLNGDVNVERLRSVCAFVDNHLEDSLSRDQAASVAHLSPSAFSRFFKQHSGSTFQAFVNDRRIGYACQLLMESERSITEVAMRCGFSSTTSFNRSFRRLKHTSPSEYRHQLAHAFPRVSA